MRDDKPAEEPTGKDHQLVMVHEGMTEEQLICTPKGSLVHVGYWTSDLLTGLYLGYEQYETWDRNQIVALVLVEDEVLECAPGTVSLIAAAAEA
jgi:hypothetical protein